MTDAADVSERCPFGACDHTKEWHGYLNRCKLCSCPDCDEHPEGHSAPAPSLQTRSDASLVERLREWFPDDKADPDLMEEAAECITELEGLRQYYLGRMRYLSERREKAEAERDRLAKALREIRRLNSQGLKAIQIATEALADTEGGE